jgi:hypothetical protein
MKGGMGMLPAAAAADLCLLAWLPAAAPAGAPGCPGIIPGLQVAAMAAITGCIMAAGGMPLPAPAPWLLWCPALPCDTQHSQHLFVACF